MKFISKSTNLRVVLQSELAAQPLSGFPGRSGMTVRFQGGLAVVDDQQWIDMMLKHPAFGVDFISAESTSGVDPYAYTRQDSEPQHVITEMKYGSPEKRTVGGNKVLLPPEAMKVVQELAVQMAKDMLPGMMEAYLKAALDSRDTGPETDKASDPAQTPKATGTGKAGRPRKVTAPAETATTE